MRLLLWIGLVVLALGIASLIVPIPHSESHGVQSGDLNIGIQTRSDQKVSPIVSAILIAGGIGIMVAGGRGR
jgi:hypothetical protein